MKNKLLEIDWIYPLIVAITGCCYYISYFDYGINMGDEGFFIYGATRVLHGQLPMSDFISYPPGSYFMLALLFKLFGPNLLVSRLMEMAFLLLNGLMVFYIGKRLMPKHMALIPSFVLIAFPGPWHKVFFAFGLLLPLVALLRFLEKRTTGRILAIGGAVGAALILKLECAFYSFSAILIILFWIHTCENGSIVIDRKAISGFLRDMCLVCFGLIVMIILVVVYYNAKTSLAKLLYSLKETSIANAGAIGDFFGRPSLFNAVTKFYIGGLENFFFFLVLLLYLYVSVKVFVLLFVRKEKGLTHLLSILLFGIFSWSYAYAVVNRTHLFQSGPIAYILFSYVMYTLLQREGTKSKVAVIVLVLLLGLYVLDSFKWGAHFLSGSISRLYAIKKEGAAKVSTPKGRIYLGKRESADLESLINFFVGKNGYLLPLYHDPMVNFLTDLENPTRYSILFPTYFKAEGMEQRVIDEVERFNITYLLVRQRVWIGKGRVRLADYAPVLYEYVKKQYPFKKELGTYLVFCRQPL
jgi:hypothetical protein